MLVMPSMMGVIRPFSSASIAVGNRSTSYTAASNRYLSMTTANWGYASVSKTKFSVSFWYKRASTGAGMYVFQIHDSAADAFDILFNSGDQLLIRASANNSTFEGNYVTTATYPDTASWHHVLVYLDTANGTSSQRIRLWYDGAEVTAFDTATAPGSAISASPTGPVNWGSNNGASSYDGLLFQQAFYNNTLVDISTVYNAGHPVALSTTGLFSLLNEDSTDAVTVDKIIATGWTNNNSVSQSSTVPS